MDEEKKDNYSVPEDVKNDPAQTYPPTQIVLEEEPIPNPELDDQK